MVNFTIPELNALVAEIKAIYAPPSILSTESMANYDALLRMIVESYCPKDGWQKIQVRKLVDLTWTTFRLDRFKTLAIDRRFRQSRDFQAERAAFLAERKAAEEGRLLNRQEVDAMPKDVQREYAMFRLPDDIGDDVDRILKRAATEREHARAMEECLGIQLSLDTLDTSAARKLDDLLRQIAAYDNALERRVTADDVIDAEYTEEPAPSLVPKVEEGPAK